MSKAPPPGTTVSDASLDMFDGDMDELVGAMIPLMISSQQGFALYDATDRLRFANSAFREALDLDLGTFPSWGEGLRRAHRRSSGIKVDSEDFETWLRSAQTRRGKLPYRTIETELRDGRWLLIAETTMPGGWMLCVMTDITELGADRRGLRQELDNAVKSSLSDELTGLSNRRYLMERLKAKIDHSPSPRVTLALIDIDYFKRVNDKYGHDFGDNVLRHFGAMLQASVGRDDLVGRLGGEEFLLATDSEDAGALEAILQKVYRALEATSDFRDWPEFSYSFSSGVAVVQPGETASATMKRADLALYKAKSTGRGRSCLAD